MVQIERRLVGKWCVLTIANKAGDHSTAAVGDCGKASAGDNGRAIAGVFGHAKAGNHGTAISGISGESISGEHGFSITDDGGAAQAGVNGTLVFRYHLMAEHRFRVLVGYIGEGGLLPDVKYREHNGQIVRADLLARGKPFMVVHRK